MRYMIIFLLFISVSFITGCAVILRDNGKMKYYGVREKEAKDTLERIDSKEDSQKRDIRWLSTED